MPERAQNVSELAVGVRNRIIGDLKSQGPIVSCDEATACRRGSFADLGHPAGLCYSMALIVNYTSLTLDNTGRNMVLGVSKTWQEWLINQEQLVPKDCQRDSRSPQTYLYYDCPTLMMPAFSREECNPHYCSCLRVRLVVGSVTFWSVCVLDWLLRVLEW